MSFYDKVRTQKFLSFSVILFTLAIGVLIGTLVQTGAKAAREQNVAPDATPLTVPSPVMMQNEARTVCSQHFNEIYPEEAGYAEPAEPQLPASSAGSPAG
jgi:serine protease Do